MGANNSASAYGPSRDDVDFGAAGRKIHIFNRVRAFADWQARCILNCVMSGETFADLLAPNLQPLKKLLRTRLRASDHADDVLQQTLLLAFAKRHQLRLQSKFKSWLWSIAFNEIRAFVRGSRPHLSLDEFPNFEPLDRESSPDKRYEQTERAERLRAGMAKLTERDRTAIGLVDFYGLSIAEAACRLSLSQSAAKSTHYRARQRLGYALRGTM